MPRSKQLHLTARDEEFPCGYGPRSIRLSQDRRHLFVGCKDGSVTWIDLAMAGNPEMRRHAARRLCPPRETGVRSICDLGNGWLLLGQDEGGVIALRWRQERDPGGGQPTEDQGRCVVLRDLQARCQRGIGYVGRWDEGVFVISPRWRDAFQLRLEPRPSEDLPFTLAPGPSLSGVLAMSGFARVGEAERWIVCKTGELWWHGSGQLEPQNHLWRDWGLERPGCVFDNAVVRVNPEPVGADPETRHDRGIYLSTDEGVFLLRPLSEKSPPRLDGATPRFRIDPVFLPGITSTCLAITHAVEGKNCLLWVSDTEGSLHLFWSLRFWGESAWQERMPVWHRSGLLERRFPVMRAVASWSPGEHRAVIGQACRDDRIVVSWYRSQEPGDLAATSAAADILSWGSVALLRGAAPPYKSRWWPEALVADHIEETGRDPEQLRRFLRNPGVDLACSALEEILSGSSCTPPGARQPAGDSSAAPGGLSAAGPSPAHAAAMRAAQAVTFWNHALIGTVHRRLADATRQDYLGIIRWLRRLGESELLRSDREGTELLRGAVESNILFARKWGVFGSTYGTRKHALAALAPLIGQETRDRRFDRLVYESLIFRRRMDLVEVLPAPARQALPPWDLQYHPPWEPGAAEYIAVSWADGGAVYRRIPPARRWELIPLESGLAAAAAPALSRRILLGTCGQEGCLRPYVLSTPAPREGRREEIELYFLDGSHSRRCGHLEVEKLLLAIPDPEARESVYCLLALGSGRVAVGLQGTLGGARFGILQVRPDGSLQSIRPLREELFPTVYPESKTLPRNPVWALASHATAEGGITLLLGCNDGQIWKVKVAFEEDRFKIVSPLVIARLAAPVTALACRLVDYASGPRLRVFAGLADGTVIAFQELGDKQRGEETYTTLWATREQSRVRSLHCFSSALRTTVEPGGDQDAQRLVLAVTQQGTAVLVLDRAAVEPRAADDPKLRRLKLPGEQLGRLALGTPVFGSALLPAAQGAPDGIEPALARLIVTPAEGGPRVLNLLHPKFTPARHRRFSELRREWLQHPQGAGEKIHGHLLRRPEATYAAAPALPAILVRWILPFEPDKESWEARSRTKGPGEDQGPSKQWLPGHLRPLVDLDTAWKEGRPLRGLLRAALLAAREVQDRALFKEILEATLSRANHQLYHEALAGGEIAFAAQFRDLVYDLEEVRGAWEGAAEGLDTRMRITIAKSLLDGDTLWSLSRSHILAASTTGQTAVDPLRHAMQGRIDVVHRFLGKGDQLLAMETLRAANRALLRLCSRLVRRQREDWTAVGSDARRRSADSHLNWETIRAFYQAVGDFAARVAHSKGTLGEVAAHEICRAYALGMLACPSEMVRLAIWLTEADLPIDVGHRVEQQLALVGDLLGWDRSQMPRAQRIMLAIALRAPQAGGYERSLFFPRPRLPGHQRRIWALDPNRVGTGNARLAAARQPFDEIIVWLHDLARQLADDAGGVDLLRRRRLYQSIAGAAGDDSADQYRHSRAFWKAALEALDRECEKFGDLFPEPEARPGDGFGSRPVRPELVLFSASLATWCQDQRTEIQRRSREHQLFAPLNLLYDEALALVERTAGRFREGAAVQKSLVLGVLSHGLLEMLDEHLLEVWEVAQALDPRRAWEQEASQAWDHRRTGDEHARTGGQRRPTSTAACFADYLLQRALKAEAIPKNLRSLQGLLGFSPSNARLGDPQDGPSPRLTLGRLLGEFAENFLWVMDPPVVALFAEENLDRRAYDSLNLTLTELAQNDRVHGMGGRPENQPNGRPGSGSPPRVCALGPRPAMGLRLEFFYPSDGEAFLRVKQLAASALQGMIAPHRNPRFPSHGTGLYLANLAAGAVGWKLELEDPRPPAENAPGTLRYRLRQTDEGGR